MIELGKQYRTEGGCDVVIHEIIDGHAFGRYGMAGNWCPGKWAVASHDCLQPAEICGRPAARLVEIRPRAIDRIIEWAQREANKHRVEDERVSLLFALILEQALQFKAEEDAS